MRMGRLFGKSLSATMMMMTAASPLIIRQKYNRRDEEMDGWIGYIERGSGVECACRHSATNPTGHSLYVYYKCFKSSNFASPAAASILYSAAPVWPNRWCNLLLYWMNYLFFFFFSRHDKIPYRKKTKNKGAICKRNSQILALPAARQTHTERKSHETVYYMHEPIVTARNTALHHVRKMPAASPPIVVAYIVRTSR